MTKLLEVQDLAHRFRSGTFGFRRRDVWAVDGVTFSIDEGETLGLVGESGCGKSTLGRLLVRLLEPSAGSVCFRGAEIGPGGAGLRRLRREIQMIFQDPFASLNPRMTVRDIVAEPLRNFGIAHGAEVDRLVAQTLDRCGLSAAAMSRFPAEFSGGQRQRIGIARALVLKPSFIVADEPVSALDVSIQAQIINLLGDLQAEFGITFLFIAHDLAIVRYISTRVAVMYLGRIVEIGAADDVFANPAHPYTRVLLSSVPLPNPREERKRRSILLEGDPPSPLDLPRGCRFHRRCPWAQFPRCAEQDPAEIVVGLNHSASCHFAGQLGVAPPTRASAATTTQTAS